MDFKLNDFVLSRKNACSVCNKALSEPVLTYPRLPLTGIFAQRSDSRFNKGIDQFFYICRNCGHGQITNCINPHFLYGDYYSFRTSQGARRRRDIAAFIHFVDKVSRRKQFQCVMDIGCNDLFLLKKFEQRSKKLIGVDPLWKDREGSYNGKISVIGSTLEEFEVTATRLGYPDLILSMHTLEHIVDPRRFLESLLRIASEKTLCIFSFPCLNLLLNRGRFEQIFHEHIQYFTLFSFNRLINELGAELIAWEYYHNYWGLLFVAFRKSKKISLSKIKKTSHDYHPNSIMASYELFKSRLRNTRKILRSFNGHIYCYGAALMLPVLFYHLGVGARAIENIIDDDLNKKGLTYVNFAVSIIPPDFLKDIGESTILISALESARQVLKKAIELHPKNIVIPLNIF